LRRRRAIGYYFSVISPKRILVFRKSSLGDIILTFPVLQTLKAEFPDAIVDYLTKSQYAPIIIHHPAVKNVIAFDSSLSFINAASRIRNNGYDLFIDLQANFQSLVLRSILISTRRVKYPKRRLARELVVRRPRMKLKVDHTVNAYLSPLKRLGIDVASTIPVLPVPEREGDLADKLIQASFPADCSRLIALCPGARHIEKRWPHFDKVAERLLRNPLIGLMIISSEKDGFPANLGIENPRLVPIRDNEIMAVAALLSKCKASVTNDSGLMHLACAVRTPVVAIFGPTNPRLGFSPTLPGSKIICDDVFCSPCSVHGKKRCGQREKYCFNNITPERVADAVLDII